LTKDYNKISLRRSRDGDATNSSKDPLQEIGGPMTRSKTMRMNRSITVAYQLASELRLLKSGFIYSTVVYHLVSLVLFLLNPLY
jgi:hypothetical protein